jgi:16S rRNA (guanine966-N2)-methyltransferase
MRIIGGKQQRRTIQAPASLPVRPTTDMAKEALFNVLNNHFDFEAIRVLDLFAGTGNISYEFASRGALEVIAVEQHFKAHEFIQATAEKLSFGNLRAVRADVFRFLGYARGGFDVVFADPPYDMKAMERIPQMVFERELLTAEGWLIVEHPAEISFASHSNFFEKRKYGRVNMSFFSL